MTRKMICTILALLLCVSIAGAALAANNTEFLYDEADLLTGAEEDVLVQKLASVSAAYEAQIVIVTIPSDGGTDVDILVEDVYDSMAFGYGENRDGVLLLVCMNPREYRILSNGYAGVAIDS